MYGRYLRLRIPHFGRDMSFCREISELYIAGCKLVFLYFKSRKVFYFFSNEIFRLNLEEGRFLEPLKSSAASLNCCQFNDYHQLFVNGTNDGKVEAWDYRDRVKVSTLDCILNNGISLEFDSDSS